MFAALSTAGALTHRDLVRTTGMPARTVRYAVGRLRNGVTVEQANLDISAIARHIHETSSEQGDYLLKDGIVVPLQDSITGKARPALLVLLGAVGFLLLVACANVANLLLAQASVRERELAIRSALGAARGRLIRQFLTEAFLLSLAGGGLGVLGALAGVSALAGLAPENLPRLDSVSISIPVLVFAFLLSTAVALPAFAALNSGDKAPQFKAKASLAGKAFDYSLADALKKGPVVVYFYPSAFTGVDKRARKAASALAAQSLRRKSPSPWYSWSEQDCSGAAC